MRSTPFDHDPTDADVQLFLSANFLGQYNAEPAENREEENLLTEEALRELEISELSSLLLTQSDIAHEILQEIEHRQESHSYQATLQKLELAVAQMEVLSHDLYNCMTISSVQSSTYQVSFKEKVSTFWQATKAVLGHKMF